MKKFANEIYKIIALALTAIIVLPAITTNPFSVLADTSPPRVAASAEMRGLWVTSAYNLDWPSRQGLSPAELRREIDGILERSVAWGINAVFVQVRPAADALYQSDIFPWSHLISGVQGQAPAEGFDPLAYWIERGHALGIEVHAWLNPYRVTFPNQRITDPASLSANHPARLNPSLVIAYNNALFFDPGNPAARQLILDGVAELLENYDLDGIHLDDYFYPSRNFPDQATFARYGGGMDLHDWRRENVNTLIRDLQTTVHGINPSARFGVSPFAIWMNDGTDPRCSATRGMESFHQQYADTRRWVLEGWVDYIVPQIYWFTGFEVACYEVVLSWWEDVVDGTDVSLYIGLAVYREVDNRPNWSGEILRQLERNDRSDIVRGSIFFRERHMNSTVGDQIAEFYRTRPPIQAPAAPTAPTPPPEPTVILMDRLIVAQPAANRSIANAANFWFFGSAVPNVPVYVNNHRITDRTDEGFFSAFLPLDRGENRFTFTQEGQAPITRIVTNNPPAIPAPPQTMAEAGVSNVFPAADEWARAGATLTLSATAPGGATVTAEIGGQTIELSQVNPDLRATSGNILSARFTGYLTIDDMGADAVVEIGRPVYTMTWEGQTRSATSGGSIWHIGADAPFFVEVTAESTWVFPQAGTAGGSHWMLVRGQLDRVTAISGNWARLASGGWVESSAVRTIRDPDITSLVHPSVPGSDIYLGFLSEGRYIPGRYEDVIVWEAPFFPAVKAEFDGEQLIVALGMQNVAPPVFYNAEQGLFSSIVIGEHNGAPAYFMNLRNGARLEGFYVEFEDGELRLVLRRRRALNTGNHPFEGFTFVVDAGHGGTDPGAVGPMGGTITESDIVLTQAELLRDRLEGLGAEVIMARSADVNVSLQERVDINRQAKPDMFISLHTNATVETTDATNIRGFTVWYRNPGSRPAADVFMNSLYAVNPATNRNRAPNQANFFVCRPSWTPSILLEASFTNNIHDFSWLINERRQVDYVWGIVNALLRYYAAG